MSLVLANSIIITVFTGSLATAYTVCQFYGVPFYNSNLVIEDLTKMKDNVIQIYFGALYMVLLTTIHIDTSMHSNIGTAFNIGLYSLAIEFLYYTYHRLLHSTSLYKKIHFFHHEKHSIYPLDALHFTAFDLSCYMACLHIPTYFLKLSAFEYIFVLFFYITMGFFAHSNLAFQHHVLHHKFFKYNYCLVFPFFDMAFETFKGLEIMDTKKFDEFVESEENQNSDEDADAEVEFINHSDTIENHDDDSAPITQTDEETDSDHDSMPDLISIDDDEPDQRDFNFVNFVYPDNIMNIINGGMNIVYNTPEEDEVQNDDDEKTKEKDD